MHIVQEVRRHQKVTVRFGFSLVLDQDQQKNLKAGVIATRFISTTQTILPPMDKDFRESERYGHFLYFGIEGDVADAEFKREFAVPHHASQFVFTLLPFSNSSTKLISFSIVVEPTQ